MRLKLTALSLLFTLNVGCDDSRSTIDESDTITDGSGSGSADGSAEGSAECWLDTGAGFCPARPIGRTASDCPGPVIEDEVFAAGTGLCAPSIPDRICPDGWQAVARFEEGSGAPLPDSLAALHRCEPPPEPPTDCPDGTLPVPGVATCQPMGVTCPPTGERWADEATLRASAPGFAGPIVYVGPDAAADGLGTRESPRLLSAAAVRAAQDGIIALSVGTHNAAVRLDRHVALLGACVTQTTLTTDQPSETLGLVDVSPSGAVRIANLTITGPRPGIWIRGEVDEPHQVEAVTIRQTPTYGILLESPQSTDLRAVRIEETLVRPSTQTLGRGIELQNGARATLHQVFVDAVLEVGLLLSGTGSTVEGDGVILQQTRTRASDGAFGRGLVVNAGASAQLRNTLIRDNRDVSVSISGAGATLDADRFVVLRTAPNARGILGRSLELKGGASVTVRDALLRDDHEVALFATDAESFLRAEGLVIDFASATAESNAYGVQCQEGARMELNDVVVQGRRSIGVEVDGATSTLSFERLTVAGSVAPASASESAGALLARNGATLSGSDLILVRNEVVGVLSSDRSRAELARVAVLETLARSSDGRAGHALQAEGGGQISGSDFHLRDNTEVAVDLSGAASQLRAVRMLVEQTRPRDTDGRAGRAFEFSGGAAIEVQDTVLRGNSELGVYASGASTRLDAERLVVSETLPQPRAGILGHGLSMQEGVSATLTDLVVSRNHGVGLIVTGEGTAVSLARAVLSETASHPVDDRFGIGLGLYNQAALTGEQVALLGNKRCGLQLAGPGVSLALRQVRISGSEVGVNLQAEGFGLTEMQSALVDEQYDSNGEDVTISAIEVPDPTTGLGTLPAP